VSQIRKEKKPNEINNRETKYFFGFINLCETITNKFFLEFKN